MTENIEMRPRKILGILAVIAASVLFGCGYTTGRVARLEGMSESCNSLWIELISIVYYLSICGVRRKNPFRRIEKKQMLLCITCGAVAVFLSNYMFMVAYSYLPVAETTMLHFLHPTLICIFMCLFFREKFTFARLLAIVCSLAGLILINGTISSGTVVGIVAAILTGVFYAVYPVLIQTTSLGEVESLTVVLYMAFFGAVSAAIFSWMNGTFMLPLNTTVLLCDIITAVVNSSGYLLTCYAVKIIGATNAGFGSMLEPITSCVIAALVLGETMKINVLYGAIFIVLSIVFSSLGDLLSERRKVAK